MNRERKVVRPAGRRLRQSIFGRIPGQFGLFFPFRRYSNTCTSRFVALESFVSLRVACPGCLAALTYPDNAGGKIRSCPRCQAEFLIPIPSEYSTPLPEPISGRTPIPSTDPRPTPRPIYKQSKLTEESRTTKHRSGDRHRSRVKVRKKSASTVNPAYVLLGAGTALVLLVAVVVIVWQFGGTTKPPDVKPTGEGNWSQNEELPSTPLTTKVDMAPGWSINESRLGYQVLWPIPGDVNNLGFTPTSSLTVGYDGVTPNNWSYAKRDESFVWSVTVIDLPNTGASDDDAALDRYVDKLKQRLSPADRGKLRVARLEVSGMPAREIVMLNDDNRTTQRAMIAKSRLWTWTVVCPESVKTDDNRIVRFLNSFKLQ